jgi:hypothetical protein|tara:strand:+ start:1589 stop:3565 length:1977 start_codon:yes stop_codon:yes gene_type:complete
MSDYGTNKKVVKKEVNYLGRDFSTIRQNIIEFAKSYFPNTYNDFNESDPGMMFIEMAAYVGDVLNFYVDNQFRETLILQAEEKKNIYDIAQSLGYKPKTASPATAEIEVSMNVPAKVNASDEYIPDLSYAGIMSSNSVVSSTSGVDFTMLDDVNFKVSSSLDPLVKEALEPSSGNVPTEFKLTKKALVKSGQRKSETFTFTSAKKFDKIVLSEPNVTEVISVTDSNGNNWYQVPYLAQDTVYEDEENSTTNDPNLAQYANDTPYLLKLIKTSKRFSTNIRGTDLKTELLFGAGISDNPDEEIIPNPDSVGSSLGVGVSKIDETFDPSNFLKTKTFGLAPSNTTLTVKYNHGGDVEHNVISNTITNSSDVTFTITGDNLDSTKKQTAEESLSFTNPKPASGGSGEEPIESIRLNAASIFNAQGRSVTQKDYITRIYSLPQKYGNIAKAFIVQDEQLEKATETYVDSVTGEVVENENVSINPNPLALNMYVLGYDANKKLIAVNRAVKENLKIYLSQYRMVTDAINIKNAYIINIGVRFNIITKRGFNKNDVLFRAIQKVKDYFKIDKWQIGQPIVLSDIAYQISLVDGVASIVPPDHNNPNKDIVCIENKHLVTSEYSGNIYDISSASRDGVVYPSLDPSIFEVKFPDSDIEGRVVGDF